MKAKFSQRVKSELSKIRETGKEYKEAFAYGLSYGIKNVGAAGSLIADRILGGNEEIGGIFLRGVFINCGSISDPIKDYHLELIPPNKEKCDELLEFITGRGLNMKQSERIKERKNQSFIYCKECEQIADFLTYIGAVKHSMELMNVIILKELRNNVNRKVNCEAANIDRTARAAGKQIRDIEYIFALESKSKKSFLPDVLREVAVVRRNNIGMSLSEIGQELDPPISKSGVNHRLRKISDIATNLRERDI
ncbi:MAG: DNA-binding protein WhiA [Oscillospiraceae bacterium]|nr:DNA-binding protein WhiA [Oscillospiraceae bacterium]